MNMNEWVAKHGISQAAMSELADILMKSKDVGGIKPGMSESAVSQRIVLAASKKGIRLFRNNVGACEDTTGRSIRYGLANISKQMSTVVKSADLIGITPVKIAKNHVGSTIGVFTSIESKREGWLYKATEHEKAQNNWLNVVRSLHGIAYFANNESVIDEICTI